MKLKYFFIAFLMSIPIWWGINSFQSNLEKFLFLRQISDNPNILAAQANPIGNFKIAKDKKAENLEISAKSAISVYLPDGKENSQKILFKKNIESKLPIASLTKLMTARIVLENYDLKEIIRINKESLRFENESNLKVGEKFKIGNFLYLLLIESNNNAAYVFSDLIGEEKFVELMNLEAKKIGMENTIFTNPTGLDAEISNLSTSQDLVKLAEIISKENPLIWKILSLPEYDFYDSDGIFLYRLKNTDKLLLDPNLRSVIIGGKTGETLKSKQSLLLVLKAPNEKGYLINIILNSEDRFGEMKKLIDWTNKSYQWQNRPELN